MNKLSPNLHRLEYVRGFFYFLSYTTHFMGLARFEARRKCVGTSSSEGLFVVNLPDLKPVFRVGFAGYLFGVDTGFM